MFAVLMLRKRHQVPTMGDNAGGANQLVHTKKEFKKKSGGIQVHLL